MRLFVVLVSLLALPVLGDEPRKITRPMSYGSDEWNRMRDIHRRAEQLRPRRRDTPLRELNITDNEVREIQELACKYAMKSMLNISPVVQGCPCEEGPLCTDQVYVVATLPEKTVGLQLSRVREAWVVGNVQKWWIRYAALDRRMPKMDLYEFMDARNQLLLEFPMCAFKDSGSKTASSREATQ